MFASSRMAAAALEPLEVVLSDELTALVHRHKIATRTEGEIDCLTIVSRGLATHGQKEVVWTVRDYYNGGLPNEPLRWYDMLLKYAKEGRIVDAYGVTEFTAKGWFGRDDIRAIVYMPPQPIPSLPGTALPREPMRLLQCVSALFEWITNQ